MSTTATAERHQPTPSEPAPVLEIMRTLSVARGGMEARLLEAARVAVAACGDELLALKGLLSVEELTSSQRDAWRAEAKAATVTELQIRLGLSREEARQTVGVACAPLSIARLAINALDRGWVTWWQVRQFWARCARLAPEAAELIAQVLFGADPALAAPERLDPDGDLRDEPWAYADFRPALDREATRAEGQDVEADRARRRRAYAGRSVSMTAHDDGTGTLTLRTDLVALCGVHKRIDRAARLMRLKGDGRTLDQLRADIASLLLLHGTVPLLDKDDDDLTPGDLEKLSRILAGQPSVSVEVVVPWDSLAGVAACPRCRHAGGDEPASSPSAPDAEHPEASAEHPEASAEHPEASAEHTEASGVHHPGPSEAAPSTADPDQPGESPLAPDRVRPGASPPQPETPATRGGVAEILGNFGIFITPGQARELAGRPGTTLYRLLTDPADGRLLERTIKGYDPDADMRRQILAADVRSRAPGSRVPATSCEIDHVVPWTGRDDGGPTCELNLASTAKQSHDRKTKRRHQAAINTRRDLTWTTLLAWSTTTRVHDYRQYLDQVLPAPATASDLSGGADRTDAPLDQDDFVALARNLYREAANRLAAGSPANPLADPETEDLDRVRLRAAMALYAALVHRGADTFLEAPDDLPEATEHGGPLSRWMWITHAHPKTGTPRTGPPADHPTPEEELGLQSPHQGRDTDPGPADTQGPWSRPTDDLPPF